MKRYLFTALAALFLAVTGCGEKTFETTLTLKDAVGIANSVFLQGEVVTLELSITNLTNSPQTLWVSSPQIHEFIVAREGETQPLWYWSHEKELFAAVMVDLEFTPGETITYPVTWNQTDIEDTPVDSGNYVAQGYMWIVREIATPGVSAETETRSAPVSFTIGD